MANQRIAQQQLERTTEEYEELRATADQALLLADQQRQLGDADQAARFEAHAESLVLQVLEHEHDIQQQGEAVVQATAAAEQAKAKVVENSERLQEKVKESDRILSDIERAKMFEALNQANRQLDDTLDDEVPTFSHVSNKVDRRLQEAIAAGDVAAILASNSTVAPAREVNQAMKSVQAQARLDERRAMLGLPVGAPKPLEAVRNDDDDVLEIPPPQRRQGA